MKATHRTSLALLVLLLACDSKPAEGGGKATASADAKADVKADIKADAKVQVDTKALADAAAKTAAEAEAKAKLAADAAAQVTVPPLKAVADVEAALGGKIALKAADLDLNGVVDLLAKGELTSGAELELFLNAPGGAAHRVDIDADGKLDYLQVVEVRADGAVQFELRAIPSSKLDASLAVLVATVAAVRAEAEGAIKLVANYSAAVEGGADFKLDRSFKADFKGDAVALADAKAGAFLGWAVDIGRPPHVSVHLSPVDIQLAADGAAQFAGDVSASLAAARLAALRAAIKVEALALAAIEPPSVAVNTGAKAKAKAKGGIDIDHSAKVESSVKVGSGGSAKVGGGGVKVGGGAGISVGGGAGISVGGGAGGSGKAGAGIKIGK